MGDHYEILGLQRDATPEQIKKAYRAQAKKHHPDCNPGDPSAEAKFKKATEAYETLSDTEKRRRYDLMGSADASGFRINISDIFTAFRSRPRRRRGANLEAAVEVGIEDVLRGARRSVEVAGPVPCGICRGSGAGDASQSRPCNCCGGKGRMESVSAAGMSVSQCPACRGSGRQGDRCGACAGAGSVPSMRTLDVSVPPGIAHGAVVRMRGHGGAGQLGGPPGDLHVRVSVRPHPLFARKADDLWQDAAVPFAAAALGGSIDVPTLEGELVLTIPPGTQSGQTFRLTGKGLPKMRSHGRGDMLVRVSVAVPTDLTDEQRDIIRSLQESLEDPGASA